MYSYQTESRIHFGCMLRATYVVYNLGVEIVSFLDEKDAIRFCARHNKIMED
jgi:hypothetical protein